jgi:hypothetical protein
MLIFHLQNRRLYGKIYKDLLKGRYYGKRKAKRI